MGVRGRVSPWGRLLHLETISLALWGWGWLLVAAYPRGPVFISCALL